MGHESFSLIVRTVGELYAFIVMLRFLLQMSHADFYNPISQAIAKMTNGPVAPFRRIIPPLAGRDLSALILTVLVYVATFVILSMLTNRFNIGGILVLSLVSALSTALDIYFYAVIASVVISWVAPNSSHPAPQLINQLTEPLFRIVRKVIPPIGGLDLSPIVIFMVIQIIQLQLNQILRF